MRDIIKEKEKINLTLNNEADRYKNKFNEINEKFEILEIEHNCLKENYDKNFMNFDCGQNK